MINILKTIRLNNWIKNLTVILPLFFSGKLLILENEDLKSLIITILSFCFASSLIYILNDLKDIEKDKLHPKKSKRPIASGKVSKNQIVFLIITLMIFLSISFFFLPLRAILFVIGYLILNIFYCFVMKNIAILDVSSISLGFVFRVMAGGVVTHTSTTHWIIILVFLLMFSIALAKRRDDLVLTKDNNSILREAQTGYSLEFIDIAKTISFTITLIAYIIYSVSEDVINRLGTDYVFITSFPVFLGIMRYIQLTIVFKKSGSPVDLLLKDKFLIATICTWIILFIAILYV